MTTPLAWEYNLEDVLSIQSTISEAIGSGRKLVNYKRRLRSCRDALAEVVEDMAHKGFDASHDEAYVHLFDALGFLTSAVRGPAVHRNNLNCALESIRGVFALEVQV